MTATDDKDRLYGKANRGDYISIAAPGVDIIAPALKGSYDAVVGHVDGRGPCLGRGGAAARARRQIGLEQGPEILSASARKPDGSNAAEAFGAGILDAAGALGAGR